MTINDAKYYESDTATASDPQVNLTRIPEKVTHSSNGNYELKLLSNRTIPILPPPMNPGIDQGIVAIILMPQIPLMPVTK